MAIRSLFAIFMLSLPWISIRGQQGNFEGTGSDTVTLEDVTISILPFREKYLEATGSVFTVQPDEIDRDYSFTSSEMVNLAPGVHMASGSLNTHRVVIRGVGSRTPYNTNRIRAYLDDIPLTSGDGISTLEDLDLFSIGSMEVLKGPSSALYGSGLGGVIRLNSPYPSDPGFRITVSGEAGSFGSQRYGSAVSFKSQSMAVNGGITRSSTDGYRENSDYLRTSAFVSARLFGEVHSLSLTLSLVDLYSEIPSSLNETDFHNEPGKAGGAWGSTGGFEEYVRMLGGIRVDSRLSNRLSSHLTLFTTFADPYERRPFNILDEKSVNLGFREFLEYRTDRVNLSAGVEYFHEWFHWKIFETFPEDQGPLLSDHSERRRYLNGFGLVQWRPAERVLVDAGINVNFLRYRLSTNYRADSTDQSGSYAYTPVFSPRIGISFRHGEKVWTYGAAGHGFSAPSLEETLLPEGTINISLRPETGWNIEIGNRGSLAGGHLSYDLTLYTIFLDDLLVTERITEDIFTGINAGKAQNTGLEVLVRGSVYPRERENGYSAGIVLGYNISRNTFRDFVDEGVDYSGNELPGIPRQELSTILTGRFGSAGISIQHQYTGSQWMNDANSHLYEGYQLMHVKLSWQQSFTSSPFLLTLHCGIRNLLDAHYASMILINAPSFGGNDPRYYYPGSPRQFHLGIRLTFAGAQEFSQ
jgi:iron complex outermembrane receptor protein